MADVEIMDIFNTAQLKPIRKLSTPASRIVAKDYLAKGEPFVFDNFDEKWTCAKRWTLDYIGSKAGDVKVSRPSEDGIYRYHNFERIPYSEFKQSLETTKDLYLGLDPIYRSNEEPHISESLKDLACDLEIPEYIDEHKLRFVNLWVGPGGNKTLLHYDPWEGLLVMLKGRKRFALFSQKETRKMYGYSVFDLKSIFEHKVLDSAIDPSSIDLKNYPKISDAHGYEGVIEEGQALYIPAGYWHYIESEGTNVAVNFFWGTEGWLPHLKRPLRDFRIKRGMIVAVGATIKFIRTYIFPKRKPKSAAQTG